MLKAQQPYPFDKNPKKGALSKKEQATNTEKKTAKI